MTSENVRDDGGGVALSGLRSPPADPRLREDDKGERGDDKEKRAATPAVRLEPFGRLRMNCRPMSTVERQAAARGISTTLDANGGW